MSVEAVSYQTSLVKLFTEIRCEYFKYDEAPFQSEMLQNTTASDLPVARSTHENDPQIDDPLFLGPGLAEHADRMKIKQNNKMSSKILPRTQRMLHCLCQVRGPQKPPQQSWWLTDYDHETADSRWKSQWRTREPLGSIRESTARPTPSADRHSEETYVSLG